MLTLEMVRRMNARFFQIPLAANPASLATGQDMPQKQIQSGNHFFSEFMTNVYNTLTNAGADDGVNRFTAQFRDGVSQVGLSSDFIDLATIAAPGRQRSVGVAGDPSQTLHIQGLPWPHLYESTGSVIVDLRSTSTSAAQICRFTWTGWLIPVSAVPTAQDFWRIVAECAAGYGVPTNPL